jgi:hypothetical protein
LEINLDYILYFFISFAGSNLEPGPAPQIFVSQETCEMARQLIITDLRGKMDKNVMINGYCVKK